MKIALINENSQAAKNGIIEAALKKVVEPMGHEVVNYGMYAADDAAQLTYVQCGILAAILLNSGAADYVITGCGTGEGAMLALNSFPGVICGHVEDPVDAYTFAHVNDGNAVAMPFAKGFGWGGELNLEYCFEKLFGFGHGQGYPKERVEPEQRNKKILDGVRAVTMRPLVDVLGEIDQDLVKGALAGEHFQEYFFANATDEAIIAKVKELLGDAPDVVQGDRQIAQRLRRAVGDLLQLRALAPGVERLQDRLDKAVAGIARQPFAVRPEIRQFTVAIPDADRRAGGHLIGAGQGSNIDPNTVLLVTRDGRSIGKLKVTSLEKNQTVADIVKDSVPAGMSIQPGDMVQLLRPLQSAK